MAELQSKPNGTRAALAQKLAELREFFVLSRALERSTALPEDRRDAARPLERAALDRLSSADVLWAKGKAAPALGLYREATLLLAGAFAAAAPTEGFDSNAPAAHFAELARLLEPSPSHDPVAPEALARLRTLVTTDSLEVGRLSGPEGSSEVSEFARAVHWLSERLELRTPFAIKLRRLQRVGVALAVAAVVLYGGFAWAFPPVNLALGKPIRASSHAYNTVPEGAVDGIRYGQLGFHSGNDNMPWLLVDLGRTTAVHLVKILGRPECCYDQSIPLALEISQDGEAFTEVARRTEPFTQYEPWVVSLGPTRARFIRLHTLRRSVLVIGELEVY